MGTSDCREVVTAKSLPEEGGVKGSEEATRIRK